MLDPTQEASDAMRRLGINVLDSSGNLISLESIVRQVGDSGATTTDIFTLFGLRAGPAMAALVGEGADALVDLTRELEN